MAWTEDTIGTERLLLRPFGDGDRKQLAILLTSPDVREFLGGPVELPDDFDTYPLGEQWGVWGVEVIGTDTPIGTCSLTEERDQLELSYSFIPSSWGHGYAFEACTAAVEWAWATTDKAELIAVTQTANQKSLALLERLGFNETERFLEYGAEQSRQTINRPAPPSGRHS